MRRRQVKFRMGRKLALALAALLVMFGITQAVVIAVHEYDATGQNDTPFNLPATGTYELCCKAPTVGTIGAHYVENGFTRPDDISAQNGAVSYGKADLVTGYTHSFWSGCNLTSGKGKAVAWYGSITDPCPSGNPHGPGGD